MTQAEKLKWSAVQNDDRITFQLVGELSRDTLLPLWNEFQKREQRFVFLSEKQSADQKSTKNVGKKLVWDLSQLSRIDSAGFALLCDFISHLDNANYPTKIENAPTQLFTLADLFGLKNWLTPFITKI